jgi:hypothetical protein
VASLDRNTQEATAPLALKGIHLPQEHLYDFRRKRGRHGRLLSRLSKLKLPARYVNLGIPTGEQYLIAVFGLNRFDFVAAHIHSDFHDTPPSASRVFGLLLPNLIPVPVPFKPAYCMPEDGKNP